MYNKTLLFASTVALVAPAMAESKDAVTQHTQAMEARINIYSKIFNIIEDVDSKDLANDAAKKIELLIPKLNKLSEAAADLPELSESDHKKVEKVEEQLILIHTRLARILDSTAEESYATPKLKKVMIKVSQILLN